MIIQVGNRELDKDKAGKVTGSSWGERVAGKRKSNWMMKVRPKVGVSEVGQ